MNYLLLTCLLAFSSALQSQSLQGNLPQHAGQEISLTGFEYYKTVDLATTVADSLGHFSLDYPKNYTGMALLNTQDKSSLVLTITTENSYLKGTHLNEIDRLVFANSPDNTKFAAYAKAQGAYGNALSAWRYLEKLYQKNALFADQNQVQKTIQEEQQRIQQEDADFIAGIDTDSYVRWFIPYRKAVQEMPVIVRKQTERIPEMLLQFRSTNFNQPNFKTSGLFKEFIEGHYLLIENMGQSLDSVYVQMNISTQYLIDNLQENDSLLNSVANNLINYFQKRSLFSATKYLSVSLLNNTQCTLSSSLVTKLERYRK